MRGIGCTTLAARNLLIVMPLPLLLRTCACLLLLLPLSSFACTGEVHVEIKQSAVYSMSYADVVAAQPGLAGCAIDQLAMNTGGKPVPVRIVDSGDQRFSEGDRIEWIGEQLHGPMSWFDSYSVSNTYVLSAGAGTHPRIEDRQAPSGDSARLERTLHLEQENLMIRLDQNLHKPGDEPDLWQWAKLTQADPAPFAAQMDLADLAKQGTSAHLHLNFRGISSIHVPYKEKKAARPDEHIVEVRINGHHQKTIIWNGREEFNETLEVPLAQLRAEGNVLELSIPKRTLPWDKAQTVVDVVMFNWLEWRYPISGNIDSSSAPFQTTSPGAKSIELAWHGTDEPVLFGSDGLRRTGTAIGSNRYRFAAAGETISLYPVQHDSLAKPALIRAVSSNDLHTPAQGADYLMVSHASLMDAVRPLAEFHEKRGLKVALLDIKDVYDAFNHGITHPRAIRNLVAHAWKNWPDPKPRFLLLVGDASFDIRSETYNDLAYAKFANSPQELNPGHFSGIPATAYDSSSKTMASRNLIPTWQFPSPEGQSASDNWFGAVDGDDYHPVVAVGRFPVVEPAEVAAIVKKTIDYLVKPTPGAWRRDVMFITDESSYFKKTSDTIADSIGEQGFRADKIYASAEEADNLAHQSAIKQGLNDGQLLVHFIGHGGRFIWRTGPPDLRKNHDLFTLDDVSKLENSGRLPMVLSMTCYSAPFDNPTEDSIGERFLREADKGAVAVFAASWRNSPSTEFSTHLVKELLKPGQTIGEGIVRAKQAINNRVLVEMYNLLGDPAVVLERPRDEARLALDAQRWDSGVLVAIPGANFSGEVALDWLDEDKQLIASNIRVAQTNTFRVSIPKFADGKVARYLQVYASDRHGLRDASAGIELARAAQPEGHGSWFDRFFAAPERPLPADTVIRRGFEQDAPVAGDH